VAFWNKRSRTTEDRSLPPASNQLQLLSAYGAAPITPLAALAIGDVWAAVRCLSDGASSLPLHVYRTAGDSRERVTSGKLVDLLDRPSPGVTQADLVSTLMCHLLVYGNAYLAKYREAGEVTQLGLLDPLRVRPELEGGRLRWRYTPSMGNQQLLTEADLIHVRGLSVEGLVGLSAVSQASRVLGLSDELVKHALSYFDSGEFQRPAGILRVAPESSFGHQERTKEKLRADAKPHGVLVIEGDAEYQAIAEKLDDSQFVENRRLAAQEIARVFRIPPHMLGAPTGDSLTYSTVEQESINFVRYSLTPWLRRIELAISNDGDLTFERQFVKFRGGRPSTRRRRHAQRGLLPRLRSDHRLARRDDALVFGHPALGTPLDASKLLKRFKDALKAAELRPIRFHDLRHTFAVRCAAAGVRCERSWSGWAIGISRRR
jgi:HK97 family phage portal protein